MKYIKTFEYNKFHEVEIGDYVLIEPIFTPIQNDKYYKKINNFLKNNYGKISLKLYESHIVVEYKNITKEIKSWFAYNSISNEYTRTFDINKVVEFGKTIEELELKLSMKKYNL